MLRHIMSMFSVYIRTGYTPLHMAAGYLHTPMVQLLMAAGADADIKDREGRSVIDLVENLKATIPLDPTMVGRRYALDKTAEIITGGALAGCRAPRCPDVGPPVCREPNLGRP